MTKKKRKTFEKLVIDESVSEKQVAAFMHASGLMCKETVLLAQTHPGIPDNLIIHHLITKDTLVLTGDRPFHNELLNKGHASIYIDDACSFTSKPLVGIKVKPDIPLTRYTKELKDDYHPATSSLRSLLLPASTTGLKKLCTKRRRIRNHFGGLANISELAITVSTTGMIIGIQIKASSYTGQKAIMASENYLRYKGQNIGSAAVCYAFIYIMQLMLQSVVVKIFYDGNFIQNPLIIDDPLRSHLQTEFSSYEFIECTKGPHIEKLRRKLQNLMYKPTNEIIDGVDLAQLLSNILKQKAIV